MSTPRFNFLEGKVRLRDLGAVLEHEKPLPIRLAIKCSSLAGSSAQRRHVAARRARALPHAMGGHGTVNGGHVFFAFDLLRLNDVFAGQFNERCLRLCIAQRGSVRPAFGGLIS